MDERVLITGGGGFIGLQLARALTRRGAHVTLIDNFFRSQLDDALRAELPRVRLVTADLTKPIDDEALGSSTYTAVYHLAAIVGVGYATTKPHQVLRTNVLALINVLDWCVRNGRPALCFTSTSEVYAGSVQCGLALLPTPEDVPLTIAAPGLPRSSYAASKIVGELLCRNYARAYAFPLRIVRYHNVYGPRMGYDHVIPQFIQRLVEGHDPFNIYGADQTRAFCYVDDAVDATIGLMDLPTSEPLIANVGNDKEEILIHTLAQRLFTIAGQHPIIAVQPPPPGSPERRCPDIARLRQLIGYEPKVDLDHGLVQTYTWYRTDLERRMAL